ncbi:hypothetical protein NSQ62_08235 [Solibacillus sp. FSL H8-0523]|uniref:hypothetical protein n=1 Tax=Solibacillus sp. FSL H8-0523 TaxID=2954511 RepID=UPI0031010166
MTKELYVNFYNKKNGKYLGGYTVRGSFKGELENTLTLKAHDHNINVSDKDYSRGFIPNHREQYPVFHEHGNDYEWLSDGWHRFHSYYKSGFKSVPVMEIIFE